MIKKKEEEEGKNLNNKIKLKKKNYSLYFNTVSKNDPICRSYNRTD